VSKLLLGALALLILAAPASAQVSLEGYFIALSDCQANKKKDSDNPGSVRLEILHAYAVIARNATPGTHYQVKVPGAPVTELRWVPMTCGAYAPKSALVGPTGGGGPGGGGGGDGSGGLPADSIEFVLAASWEPAFCATGAGNGKPECDSLTADRFDATHFALHGLWPDNLDDKAIFPCYCDRGAPVACGGTQPRDTSISLSAAVKAKLSVAMPGVQSGLELHEWPKHGSCYEDDKTGPDAGADPDEYFTEAMAALAALNDSDVAELFADNRGQVLSRQQIEAALDDSFGAGAAQRVIIKCTRVGGENVILELWIGLKGSIGDPADLAALIQAAPPTSMSTNDTSCASGRVVAVTAN
jgi:ribonuclease T2